MSKFITEKDILKNINVRNYLANKTEVLDIFKPLNLMPGLGFVSIDALAEYYEINIFSVRNAISRHRKEMEKDGAKVVSKFDLLKYYYSTDFEINEKDTHTTITDHEGKEYFIPNRGMLLLTKKAALRIGLLLRKSDVAIRLKVMLMEIVNNDDSVDIEEIKGNYRSANNIGIISKGLNVDEDSYMDKVPKKRKSYTYPKKKNNKSQVLLQEFIKEANENQIRTAITTMITRLAIKRKLRTTALCWEEFCILLKSKKGIRLASRRHKSPQYKKMPLVDLICKDEFEDTLSIAMYLCEKYDMDIKEILSEVQAQEQ